nr:hypothetical protein [Ardenticatena sp.]
MLRVEWRIFVRNRRFIGICLAPLCLILIQAFVAYAATQVGLIRTTGSVFTLRSLNLYSVLFLPFLAVATGVYLLAAEFQWQTIRRPFIEHIARQRFLLTKVGAAGITLVFLMLPYLLGTLLVAAILFGFTPELIEDRQLSVFAMLVRFIAAYLWTGFLLYLFVVVGQLLFLRTKNLLLAILGALLPFYVIAAFGDRLPIAPLRLLFALQQHLLEAAVYDTTLLREGSVAVGVWGALFLSLLFVHLRLFTRQDILIH